MMSHQKLMHWALGTLLLLDLFYSLAQFYHQPLDGDLAAIVLPSEHYREVLASPFGLAALRGKVYPGPNRYFCHASMSAYFKAVPNALPAQMEPISRVYLACALFKVVAHTLILSLLAWLVARATGQSWLLAAAVLCPLFQTNGFNGSIGIVHFSVTYAWFYTLPMAGLMLFFAPFLVGWARLPATGFAGLLALAVVLPLSGPLMPPVALLACTAIAGFRFWQKTPPGGLWKMPGQMLALFAVLAAMSLYSIYIGQFNAENGAPPPLADRYGHLLTGIWHQLSIKIGLPLLLVFTFINVWLMRRARIGGPLLQKFGWSGAFCLLFIALLPLGGYREYRSTILRSDTMLPATICLFFVFASSSACLLRHFSGKNHRAYSIALAAMLLVFVNADEPGLQNNRCERDALRQIANAPTTVVPLSNDCPVMDWRPNTKPEGSAVNGQMLHLWDVTHEPKLFFKQ